MKFQIHWMHYSKETFSKKKFASREEAKTYAEIMGIKNPRRYSFYEVFEVGL